MAGMEDGNATRGGAEAQVLETLALVFAPCDETVWGELIERKCWDEVIESCGTIASTRDEGLSNLLSEEELRMLDRPLSYGEKRTFEAAHFTGGLPESAMPVESLYREPEHPGEGPRYEGPSAAYMRSLVDRMGLELPGELAAYPDHLAVEADMAALLVRSGAEGAAEFVATRLDWLAAYRSRLVRLREDERCFYCAFVDVALAIVESATMQLDAKDQNDLSFERKEHV